MKKEDAGGGEEGGLDGEKGGGELEGEEKSSNPSQDTSIFLGVAVPVVVIGGVFLMVRRKREIRKWQEQRNANASLGSQGNLELT